MAEKMIKVVYPNGYATEYRKDVADILLKKGAVETEAAYRKRIEAEIKAKKGAPEPDKPDEDETGDNGAE